MGNTKLERAIHERQLALSRSIAGSFLEARLASGLSIRAVARAARIHPSHVHNIERGERAPSPDSMAAIATVLGREVSIRLFESRGPRIRDHVQAQMVEALLGILHPAWWARLEVPVYRPVRGVIDVVLQHREMHEVVAGEGHSQLRTVEQQLRWAAAKTDALPSATGWPWADALGEPRVSRLLLLRSSAVNRDLVAALPATFRAAYPARTEEAYRALTTGGPWPGAAILWVDVAGARTRVLHGSPRGVDT